MKRIIWAIVLCAVIFLHGCGRGETVASSMPAEDDKIDIVCTIFPQYDWTRQILGDTAKNVNLTLLSASGADMHSYQPTAADIALLANADIVIYVGGTTEDWIRDALAESGKESQIVINMMDVLEHNVLEEEIIEGMEHPEDECTDDCHHEHAVEDEHLWLSLQNAKLLCAEIAAALQRINPNEATLYEANYENYCMQVEALRERYRSVTENAESNVLVFADRFPFRYFVEEWNLEYYAAFPGCFAETEASFDTIIYLAEMADLHNLPAVIVLENSDTGVAETVIENSQNEDREILVMNSMQSVSAEDIEAGASYLNIMEDNLEVLIQALDTEE